MVCDFWKKVFQGARMAPKVSTKHTKNCAPEFPILSALKLHSCDLVVFINKNAYLLTEDKNLKTFLKENYSVGLDSCYIFTKNMLNMELNIMLMVPMEFACIRNF